MKTEYTLIRSSRKTMALQIKDGAVIVRAPSWVTRAQADDFVRQHRSWIEKHLAQQEAEQADLAQQPKLTLEEIQRLGEEAISAIPERVRFYAEQIGVTYGRITIRTQRTRWGSCSSKGNLNFNCLLMLMPREVLDCVVVHELCHLKEMNHSAQFYDEVRRVYPEYDKWNYWLKKNGKRYMSRIPE